MNSLRAHRLPSGHKTSFQTHSYFPLVFLPPAISLVVAWALLMKLGSATWLDAQTWPVEFHGPARAGEVLAGGGICRAFVFITALLVFLNNIFLYLREVLKISEEAHPDSPRGRGVRSIAFSLAVLATLLVAFWLADTILSILPATVKKHEVFALVIFSLFGVIDWLISKNARQAARDIVDVVRQARLEAEADYYGHQLSYTDAAVVAGMLALLAVESMLKDLPAFIDRFKWGFATGAIGMHLAYSQFVFLALTMNHRKILRQINLEEHADTAPDELSS